MSNSCPLVFLFSPQQPHAPPTTSPSSVRRASTSPPLRAPLLFGQVLSFRHHFNECEHFISHLYFLFAMTGLSRFYRLPLRHHRGPCSGRKVILFLFSPVFTPRVVSTAVARYNFAARDMRELSLREGDMVRIYSKIGGDQGWWKGEANGRVSVP